MNKKYRDINRYPYFFVSKIITNINTKLKHSLTQKSKLENCVYINIHKYITYIKSSEKMIIINMWCALEFFYNKWR